MQQALGRSKWRTACRCGSAAPKPSDSQCCENSGEEPNAPIESARNRRPSRPGTGRYGSAFSQSNGRGRVGACAEADTGQPDDRRQRGVCLAPRGGITSVRFASEKEEENLARLTVRASLAPFFLIFRKGERRWIVPAGGAIGPVVVKNELAESGPLENGSDSERRFDTNRLDGSLVASPVLTHDGAEDRLLRGVVCGPARRSDSDQVRSVEEFLVRRREEQPRFDRSRCWREYQERRRQPASCDGSPRECPGLC